MGKLMVIPKTVLVFLALAVLGFLFYGPALRYPFVHDDVAFIQANPDIGRWDNLADVFLRPGLNSGGGTITTLYYRPALEAVYRLHYALVGMSPSGFHALNIGWHVANAWLFWNILTIGLACSAGTGFFLALIFLLHPVQTQTVACVSGISNLAVGFFLLTSFVCYLKARCSGRDRLWLVASLLAFLPSLLIKETAIVYPLVIVGYEHLYGRGRRGRASVLALAAVAAGYLVWRQGLSPGFGAHFFENGGELKLRLLSIPAALLVYGKLIAWPVDLHYYRSLDLLAPKLSPMLFVFGTGLLIAALLLKVEAKARRQILFGLGWALIFLLPVLNIIPLINEYSFIQAAEHFVYLPLAGVLMAVAALVPRFRSCSRQVLLLAAVGMVLACGMLTFRQLPCWRSEVALFERAAAFEPQLGRVRLLLAKAYTVTGRYDEALVEYNAALQIMSDYVKKAGLSKAAEVYAQYIKEIYFDRGQVFGFMGDSGASTRDYLNSLSVALERGSVFHDRARDSRILNQLGLNMVRSGEMLRAERYIKAAVMTDANDVEALNNLGMVFLQKNNTSMARFWFERALKVRPGFGLAWENLKKLDVMSIRPLTGMDKTN